MIISSGPASPHSSQCLLNISRSDNDRQLPTLVELGLHHIVQISHLAMPILKCFAIGLENLLKMLSDEATPPSLISSTFQRTGRFPRLGLPPLSASSSVSHEVKSVVQSLSFQSSSKFPDELSETFPLIEVHTNASKSPAHSALGFGWGC